MTPLLKWVGGKRKLLPQLLPLLPDDVEKMLHIEPFIGGGALFFAQQPKRAILSDVNADLIGTYLAVRNDVEIVIGQLKMLAAEHSQKMYYQIRDQYNGPEAKARFGRAAMFIYLNKTCFNGVHRVNKSGEFNVPAGQYKNPRICDVEQLRQASVVLSKAHVQSGSFEYVLAVAQPGDFIYLDPPYDPVSATSNFTTYAQGGFDRNDQQRLRDTFGELDNRRCNLMLSNSDTPFIRKLYADFNIDTVQAGRSINSNGKKRGAVTELVVRNY